MSAVYVHLTEEEPTVPPGVCTPDRKRKQSSAVYVHLAERGRGCMYTSNTYRFRTVLEAFPSNLSIPKPVLSSSFPSGCLLFPPQPPSLS